ncbi:MAG TPA: hypothetical protein VMH81_34880 [Bryobacteraceae bacterium]|nr:hypothetical protein [Bryobacteraceae bacterium]
MIAMFVYRWMGLACIVAVITNAAKHGAGFSLSGTVWPVLLAFAMFALGAQPRSTLQASGKWPVRYFAAHSLATFFAGDRHLSAVLTVAAPQS